MSARFFKATMQNHTLHVKANEEGKAVSNYSDDDATSTPQKEKPRPHVAPRRPFVPVKKDGSAHKGQMRIISTITHKCKGCKKAKEKICPPTKPTDDYDVWNYFTNDKDGEDEDDKYNEDDEDDEDDE
ncbi:hypothetical protein VE02_10250 [Pseudogymnoascus sp. 03VT05]|nr:hypothetical protein VE02_10250 [Pseudogymnoascus sp. 03VT05]